MKKRIYVWSSAIVLLFAVTALLKPLTAQAANPPVATLEAGVTYTDYDVTGDKKADRVEIQTEYTGGSYRYSSSEIKIFVNGKMGYQFLGDGSDGSYDDEVSVVLYTLKNGKPFLFLDNHYEYDESYDEDDNDDSYYGLCAMFQYKAGELKKIIDFARMFSGYDYYKFREIDIKKVQGNSIVVDYGFTSHAFGRSDCRFVYKYKKGTLECVNGLGTLKSVWTYNVNKGNYVKTKNLTASRSLKAYTSVKAKKKAFTLKRGSRFALQKVYWGRYGAWIYVKYNGKKGYIRIMNDSMIENIMYD